MVPQPLIELAGVAVALPDGRPSPRVSFNVMRGEFGCLHGSTGSGKSLALKLIAGLADPCAGEVRVAGELVNEFSERQRLWLRRSMGFMMQRSTLLEDFSVMDNVMLPALAAEEPGREARARAERALERCGITILRNARVKDLSAGQRQLVSLAQAVINHPVVILADEPAAHLDAGNAQALMDLLGNFSLAGVAVIVASHLRLAPSTAPCRTINLDAFLERPA